MWLGKTHLLMKFSISLIVFFVLFFFSVAFGKYGELISSKSDIVLLPCLVLLRYAAREDG